MGVLFLLLLNNQPNFLIYFIIMINKGAKLMDNSQNNIGLFLQMPVCDGVFHSEISSDFTLPDYKSEIRKLLSTKVKILPPRQYIGNKSANTEGEIIYKILYVSTDGLLYSATLSDKYSFNMEFDFDSNSINTDDITLNCYCECESVSTRVGGPRRLSIKSKLACHALALSPSMYTPEIIGAYDKSSIERMIVDAPSLLTKCCESEPITLTDTIATDPQVDNIRIIDSSASVLISECSASADKINVRGDVYLKLFYCNDAQNDEGLVINRKIPFSTSIFCDGISNIFEACANAVITDEDIRIDDNGISIELSLKISALAQRNHATPYIQDAYSTKRACSNESMNLEILKSVKAFNGNLTHSESFSLGDIRIDPNARIIDCDVKARINSVVLENGKTALLGSCQYQILTYLNGEYSICEASSPMRYECDIRTPSSTNDIRLLFSAPSIISARARNDGEHLFVDCELSFGASLIEKYQINLLHTVNLGELLQKSNGELTLCYPHNAASLWSIAKQYGEPMDTIRSKNSVSETNDISKKKFLII